MCTATLGCQKILFRESFYLPAVSCIFFPPIYFLRHLRTSKRLMLHSLVALSLSNWNITKSDRKWDYSISHAESQSLFRAPYVSEHREARRHALRWKMSGRDAVNLSREKPLDSLWLLAWMASISILILHTSPMWKCTHQDIVYLSVWQGIHWLPMPF